MKKGAAMKLQFVIQSENNGMFWGEAGWCASADLATQFSGVTAATEIARRLAADWDESMKVILRGPYVVNTIRPTRQPEA